DRPDPGGEGPRRQMAVAHHLAVALVIEAVAVLGGPVGDFGPHGLCQGGVRSLAKDTRKDIFCLTPGHEAKNGGRKTHGGVLLCRGGTWVDLDTPRVRRPFSTRYPQHSIIPLPRNRFIQLCVRSTTQRRALNPAFRLISCASSPRALMCAV